MFRVPRLPKPLFAVAALCAVLLSASAVFAQSRSSGVRSAPVVERPIFVINAASFERVLSGSDRILKMLDRADLSLGVRGAISLSTNGLKGIDRKRPFGVMTYINSGTVPEPVGVVYVPVTDATTFLASLADAKLSAKPVSGLPGAYTVSGTDRRFSLRFRGTYAFLARTTVSLRREFPDPAARFASLSRDADVSLLLQLSALPVRMKTMVLDYLRAATEPGVYATRQGDPLRPAIIKAVLAALEEVLADGESLTIGLRLPDSTKSASLLVRLVARRKTPLAAGLKDAAAGRRRIRVASGSGFQFSANWKPPDLLATVLDAFIESTSRTIGERESARLKTAWKSLRQAVFSSGLRVAVWTKATKSTDSALVAAVTFPDAKSADVQVRNAIVALRAAGVVADPQFNAAGTGTTHVHRFTFKPLSARGVVEVVDRTAWFAIGAKDVLPLLQNEIAAAKRVANTPEVSKTPGVSTNRGREIVHLQSQWSDLNSLFAGGTSTTTATGGAAPLSVSVSQSANSLTIRTGLPAVALRQLAAPILKRLLPR